MNNWFAKIGNKVEWSKEKWLYFLKKFGRLLENA